MPKPEPVAPKASYKNRRGTSLQKRNPDPYFAKLKREDPEKLKALSQEASAKSKASPTKTGTPGIPAGFTKYEWAIHLDAAQKLTHRIMQIMDKEGALPTNPIAREAMKSAIELLASDINVKDKLTAIRTLLEYNMARPAAATNITLKTSEDFLDEIASNE